MAVIKTGIAAKAGSDRFPGPGSGLVGPLGVGHQRPCQTDDVSLPGFQDGFCFVGFGDAAYCDHRDVDVLLDGRRPVSKTVAVKGNVQEEHRMR